MFFKRINSPDQKFDLKQHNHLEHIILIVVLRTYYVVFFYGSRYLRSELCQNVRFFWTVYSHVYGRSDIESVSDVVSRCSQSARYTRRYIIALVGMRLFFFLTASASEIQKKTFVLAQSERSLIYIICIF